MLLGATGTETQNEGGGESRTAGAEGTGLHGAKRRKAGRRPQRQLDSILDSPGDFSPYASKAVSTVRCRFGTNVPPHQRAEGGGSRPSAEDRSEA